MAKTFYEYNKLMNKKRNEEMWVNGMYTLNALNVALNNAFDKRKIKYLSKPLDIYPKTEAEKEVEKNNKINSVIKWLNNFRASKK